MLPRDMVNRCFTKRGVNTSHGYGQVKDGGTESCVITTFNIDLQVYASFLFLSGSSYGTLKVSVVRPWSLAPWSIVRQMSFLGNRSID